MSLAFRIKSGRDTGKIFQLVEGFIGTQPICEIQLSDPSIAPIHAKLSLRKDHFTIADLTDAPDVRVNEQVVKTRAISRGDLISIASVQMEVIETADEPAASSIIVHDIGAGPVAMTGDEAPSVTQRIQAANPTPPPPLASRS